MVESGVGCTTAIILSTEPTRGCANLQDVFFLQPLFVMLPLFIKKTHFGSENDLALLMILQQAGLTLGSVLMSFWKGFQNNAKGVAIGLLVMYLGYFITTSTPIGTFGIAAFGLFIVGFTLPMANVSSQTIWQKIVSSRKKR